MARIRVDVDGQAERDREKNERGSVSDPSKHEHGLGDLAGCGFVDLHLRPAYHRD